MFLLPLSVYFSCYFCIKYVNVNCVYISICICYATYDVRGLFINYWDSVILHEWTHELYFSLPVNYQSHDYTRLIAESIRRASLGGMRSTPTSQTLHQQVAMTLMRLWQRHSFSMFTSFNRMHFIWSWTHLSNTYVQLIAYVQMLLWCSFTVQYPSQCNTTHSAIPLTVQYPLTVWTAPHCSEFNTSDVTMSVSTSHCCA